MRHRIKQLWYAHIALSNNQIGLVLLATLAGLVTGLIIAAFRFAVELPLVELLPMAHEDDYEALTPWLRAAIVLIGGLILILIFRPLSAERRSIGVAHVLLRLERHQGYLPFSNIVLQWLAAVIALLSGHSAGREGPAIHLGAGTASQIGQAAGLAHHRLRILAGCGVASAIAASFNTPMAGVIFAMEVVLLEYSIRGFIPIILASVMGAIVTETLFGSDTVFTVSAFDMRSLLEIPYILALGVACGIVATGFLWTLRTFQKLIPYSIWIKWGGLSVATALTGFWLPELLGIGYDTVNAALAGQVVISTLLLLLIGKCLLAAWGAAVGFPAGVIGPSLFMGAALGGTMGQLSAWWLPEYPASIGFYTLLGMAAMMGAVIRAPLAALVALLELTGNPNIIMPGMLAIVVATLVVSEIFKLPSVFHVQMAGQPIAQTPSPVQQMLRNTWVADAMEKHIPTCNSKLTRPQCEQLLSQNPESNWVLLTDLQVLIPVADIASAFSAEDVAELDLGTIPAERHNVRSISLRANLQDALDQLDSSDVHWLAVYQTSTSSVPLGILSRGHIEHFYRYRPNSYASNTPASQSIRLSGRS